MKKIYHLKMDNEMPIVQTNQAGYNSHHRTTTTRVHTNLKNINTREQEYTD